MLTKTILKKALNVKHTSIDNVTFDPDDSIIVRVHPTKGEQCRCGKCGRKAPRYDAGGGLRRWRTCDMNTTSWTSSNSWSLTSLGIPSGIIFVPGEPVELIDQDEVNIFLHLFKIVFVILVHRS